MAKHTILVVEDEESIRRLLEDDLLLEGYNVISAVDGDAAVKVAFDKQPDLILLDVMLPKKSGFEVCREIKEKQPRIPIILLTAKSQEKDKLYGFKYGADDYITKPFSMLELLARVKAVLHRVSPFEGISSIQGKMSIIATDMKDYTMKSANLSRGDIMKLMEGHHTFLTSESRKFHGRLLNMLADSSLIVFENPDNALEFGVSLQNNIKVQNKTENNINKKIELRLAIHIGEIAIAPGGELAYGEAINLAARVSKISQVGEVYLTEDFYNNINNKFEVKDLGKYRFKGISREINLYKVVI